MNKYKVKFATKSEVDVEAIRAALVGSRWCVESGTRGAPGVTLAAGEERAHISGGEISADAPIDLLALVMEPDTLCPNRSTGCEWPIYPWQAQCNGCGAWRE